DEKVQPKKWKETPHRVLNLLGRCLLLRISMDAATAEGRKEQIFMAGGLLGLTHFDPIDILKALLEGKVKLENWDGSHNGRKLPDPIEAEFKTQGLTQPVKMAFKFKEVDGTGATKPHTLVGARAPFSEAPETIEFDGISKPFPANHIA